MSDNLPATQQDGIYIRIPNAAYIREKLSEPGPVRGHFKTTLVMLALGFFVMACIAFPNLFPALCALGFFVACYAFLHWAIYTIIFNEGY
jgi:hypothetical protein